MPKYTNNIGSGPLYLRSATGLTVVGTTHAYTALSDSSDATYCKLKTYTLPADMAGVPQLVFTGERIVSVCPFVRSQQPGAKTVRCVVAASLDGVNEGIALALPRGVATITD